MLRNYEGDDRKQLHTWVTATAGQSAEEKIRENLKNGKEGKGLEMSERESATIITKLHTRTTTSLLRCLLLVLTLCWD